MPAKAQSPLVHGSSSKEWKDDHEALASSVSRKSLLTELVSRQALGSVE